MVSCSANFFVQAEQGKDYKGHGDMEGRRGHFDDLYFSCSVALPLGG